VRPRSTASLGLRMTKGSLGLALLLSVYILTPTLLRVVSSHEASVRSHPDASRPQLSLAARASYQRAVDEVYWRHALLPKSSDRLPLAEVISPAETKAKVDDALRKSDALQRLWRQQITSEMLQAEMDRMVRNTKRPEILGELFAALDQDPNLIAEVLVRPIVADRLIRQRYSADSRFSTQKSFDVWWSKTKTEFTTQIAPLNAHYELGDLNNTAAAPDTWRPMSALPVFTGTAIWTGTEMIVWGGGGDSGSRYNPTTDTWSPTSTINAPRVRNKHTAVWTGSEMIVWGGCNQSTNFCGEATGGRYNPLSDTWTATSNTAAPRARKEHTAVWTGSEMIIWGGCNPGGNNFCNRIGDGGGGAYNPTSDTWRAIDTVNSPAGRTMHTAVWTGTEMIVWGGVAVSITNTGGRYNPTTNTWAPTTLTNAPAARMEHTAVWTGSVMIVWGGRDGNSSTAFNTGGRYNPTSDSWEATSLTNAPAPRIGHIAVWTGTEMIVWGGDQRFSLGYTNSGGRYRPDSDSWLDTNQAAAPSARANHVAVWTGSLMIVWSTADNKTGGRYDPVNDSWSATNNLDSSPTVHDGVWTGTELIVWGTHPNFLSGGPSVGGRYDPALDVWRPINLLGAPRTPPRDRPISTVWTGAEIIVWGMGGSSAGAPGEGGRYNPASDSWTAVSTTNAPVTRSYHTAVWTGNEMLVWGGQGSQGGLLADGGRYNAATNSWQHTTASGAPEARYIHTAVWSGNEMIVWGGVGVGSHLSSGGRYNPVADSWQPTTTNNAPIPRRFHTAIWTGNEMIIWGGRDGDFNSDTLIYDSGGRYNPTTDSWVPTNLAGAPLARFRHSAVWTGAEMIVWGGLAKTGVAQREVSTGSRYSPISDSWTTTNILRAASARSAQVAVWTGMEMIIWGGDGSGYTGAATHGALYTPPAAASPTPTPTPTPTPIATPTPTPVPSATPTPTPVASPTPTATPTPVPTPMGSILSFSSSNYVVTEAEGHVAITVNRSGDTSSAISVSYHTGDKSALQKSDYTAALGTLNFAPGETAKVFSVLITQDTFVEGPETLDVVLSDAGSNATNLFVIGSPGSTTLTINDDQPEAGINPIDIAGSFVNQHYHDFLNREADAVGRAFWTDQIMSCGDDAACRELKRVNVSAAYFRSIEFQETGYLVYRIYKSAYGNLPGAPVPLSYAEFLPDTQQMSDGLIVNAPEWQAKLEHNKTAFLSAFVTRARFVSAYPTTMSPESFVDALYAHAEVVPSVADRAAATAEFGGAADTGDVDARARALRRVAENSTLNRQEVNKAFVLMQYFGYLRRSPNEAPDLDFSGYDFWLRKLNDFGGDFVRADMVKAFILSGEYRQRFSP
jgi:N-acetylneuraminic acid mutarotase